MSDLANVFDLSADEVVASNDASQVKKDHASSMDATIEALSTYAERYTAAEPPLLIKLREETRQIFDGE